MRPTVPVGGPAVSAGPSDIAVGNVVGSSIFNILAVLGIGALVAPLTYGIAREAGSRPEVRWGAAILAALHRVPAAL